MLQKMGAPPEVAEVWVAEYAEIAHLPQSIQLSWLIAGNPLAKDYQLYIEDVLATFNLNALLAQNPTSGNFSSPTEWVDQDPFWEEVQKQPLLNIFFDLLDNASEEIKRSFIVSLFFLEPIPYGIEASSKNNEENNNNESFNLRSKPFFWSDTPNTNIDNLATPTIESISIVDPDQDLVAEALKQKNNLIKYWLPEQGYRIIPWSQRELLNPSEEGANYFIMAVTALSSFAPMKKQNHKTNYATIVSSIVNNHLPKNQPVFKVFVGPEVKDRQVLDNQGLPIYFAGSTFSWSADKLNNIILRQARTFPYMVVRMENGVYMAGSLLQLREFFEGRQDYTVETVVLRASGITHYPKKPTKGTSTSGESKVTWLSDAGKVAQEIFALSTKQDKLFIQSANRSVLFEKSDGSDLEIKTSSMITWKDLPTNEELLVKRRQWHTDAFLVKIQQGYLLIPTDELKYLQAHSDEELQVHSLLLASPKPAEVQTSAKKIFQNKSLNCESIRVLSITGLELAYSPQCSLIVADSGWELAQAKEEVLLKAAQKSQQPIVIFRPDNKPASASFLNFLKDAEQSSLEGLQVSTLVPIYSLEGLDDEEKENTINISITDAISRTLQFFPKQKEFEVLMPQQGFSSKQIKYTSITPEKFSAEHDYDEINVVVPIENQQITFYRLRESR